GAIARELIRLGCLEMNTGQFPTVSITAEGRAVLRERRRVELTRPREVPKPRAARVGDIEGDPLLFEKLRRLRKELADHQGVPPYIVFGDTTLRLMARRYPQGEAEFRAISGVGEAKWRSYGAAFDGEIREHLRQNPRMEFRD
ncbi:MAG: HRDC domain-containing protein, partial [Verrucomicrobiota bacterium]